jgi:hypothetical protein
MSTSEASTPASADRSLRGLLLLLATIAGVAVANIYYNQPLLDNLRLSFPNSASWVGGSRSRSFGCGHEPGCCCWRRSATASIAAA